MLRILFVLFIVLSITSCKDTVVIASNSQKAVWQVSLDSLPKKSAVLPKAQTILNTWKEYAALETSLTKINKTESREDLILLIEELIEAQKKMETSVYPKKFDIPHIKGRQKVVKTFLLKVKGDLEYRQNPQQSLLEMLDAFNELRNQFNVTVNSTLPEELRSNEKK